MNKMLGATTAIALVFCAQSAVAQDIEGYTIEDDGWTYQLQLYVWGTDVGGVANDAEFELGFGEIVENLNFVLMGGLQAYKDDWMTYGELGYADIRQGGEASFNISPGPGPGKDVDAVHDADIQTTVVSFGAGYRLVDNPGYNMYATFGARYLRMDVQMDLDVGKQSFAADETTDYWDAVIGLQGKADINENWFVSYKGDIGGGESDLTWQAALGVGYDFGRSDIVFGYRHMEWDLPDDRLVTEYYQSGPMLLWNYRF